MSHSSSPPVGFSARPPSAPATEVPVGRVPWWLRLLCVVGGLAAWFGTQSLIGSRAAPEGLIGDGLFDLTANLHEALHRHPTIANLLLITSSAVIDAIGIWLLCLSIFGPSLRPFLALLLLFGMRQICQALCVLPPPESMIWHSPGIPTLLVTYGVAGDLFFSGRTGLAVLGACELGRTRRPVLVALGIAIALFEAATVICLRAHYTMDVFTGAVTALWVSRVAERIAPWCDRQLASRTSAINSARQSA